jgi:hypothetical protein
MSRRSEQRLDMGPVLDYFAVRTAVVGGFEESGVPWTTDPTDF